MEKENIHSEKGLEKLKIYFTLWCIFLVFMTISLLLGVHRGLVFYDFAYELNFILAFSGVFISLHCMTTSKSTKSFRFGSKSLYTLSSLHLSHFWCL
jgi:hypothetical protein